MDWHANNVRYVAFTPTTAEDNAGQIFFSLTGHFPTQMQQGAPFGGAAGAQIDGYWVNLSVQPGRIHIDAGPPAAEGMVLPPPMSDIAAACALMRRYLPKLLSGREVYRSAVVVEAIEMQPSSEAARKYVHSLLPFLDLPEGAIEVMYQINVPTVSETVGIAVNRMCRWNAVTVQAIPADALGTVGMKPIEVGAAALLLVDVNTTPTHEGFFEAALLEPLFAELENAAMVILHKGYDGLR